MSVYPSPNNTASAAMPHSASSLPPCYRHTRLTIVILLDTINLIL